MKFKIGDRVERQEDVYDENSPMKHGEVIKVYSRPIKRYGPDLTLGPYPELYAVKWDNGKVGKGYLPHGITLIP